MMETYSSLYKKIYVSTKLKRRETYIKKDKITKIVSSYFNEESNEEQIIEQNQEQEKNLTKKELLEIYSNKVYDNKPLDINNLTKDNKNLCEYAIQIGWLNSLKEKGKITQVEYDKTKVLLMNKYKIKPQISL